MILSLVMANANSVYGNIMVAVLNGMDGTAVPERRKHEQTD